MSDQTKKGWKANAKLRRVAGSRAMTAVPSQARPGSSRRRPQSTRPAGPELYLAGLSEDGPTRDHDLDFAPWHAPQGRNLRILARQGTRRTEADIVVPVRRRVPVTVGGADVRRVIVERVSTQHTATRPSP